jgi:hypothetical protein
MSDPGQTALPPEADFLREAIKVVEWQRDNARQERNEERARASAAEAEVAKLTRDLMAAQHEVTDHGMLAVKANQRTEAAEATVSALRDRVAVLEEALKPFCFGDATLDQILFGGMPDNATCNLTVRLRDTRSARAALTQGGENAKA